MIKSPKVLIITASLVSVAVLSGVAFTVFSRSVSADPQAALPNSSALSVQNVFPIPTAPGGSTNPGVESSSDYLLEIDDLQGEKESIEIASWSLGASNPTSVGSSGMSAGKASFSDLSVMKSIDKASPLLFKSLATGKHIPKVTLTKYAPNTSPDGTVKPPTVVTQFTLTDVMVSSVVDGSFGASDMEMLSLSYAKIEMKKAEQPVQFGWDLKANKKL